MFGSGSSGLWDAAFPEHSSTYTQQANSLELTGLCQGDFYRESDDVVRGVSIPLPLQSLESMLPGSGLHKGFFETELDGFGTNGLAFGVSSVKDPMLTQLSLMKEQVGPVGGQPYEEKEEDFQACFAPPAPPSSQHFRLEATTVSVDGGPPHEIANRVLDFLRSQVVASITKVRPAKYTVRADVFQDGAACALKVRVYRLGGASSPRYSVEFQRRSGCAFAFRSVYDRAAAFIGEAFTTEACPCAGTSATRLLEPPVPLDETELDFDDVAPLLDMARSTSLQAEAAASLSRLADGGRGSAKPLLQQPKETAMALEQLITCNTFEAAYPAACALMSLASYPESGPLLATPGLLQSAVRGIRAEAVPGPVRDALAQSVGLSVRSCAAKAELPPVLASELHTELEGVLRGSAVPNLARGHLEEALFTLQAMPCH